MDREPTPFDRCNSLYSLSPSFAPLLPGASLTDLSPLPIGLAIPLPEL